MAVVFINSYTGILVSYLMAPKFLPLITTVQSLADSREITVAVSKHTSVEAALFAATSGPLAKIGDQLRAHPEDRLMTTLENIEDKAFYQGKAFAHEETTLFVRIHDDLLSTRHCRLAIAKELLFSDQQALALAKSSPQTSLFNYEIVWLQQMGLLNYWRATFLPKPNRCSAPVPTLRSTPTEKLTLNNLSSAFLLLCWRRCFGFGFCFGAHFSEIQKSHSNRRS
ncbi:uncharacterized protein LOC124342838 [Daphnia pulicaria]|uniref:uncharacterized protein LOC124342838 n=1 Tax=Daphnia pulicaria TaxID=35523 RepID=UPI001EEC6FC8|nr:uncharacterized protein LOC124342838 [Daphnia pulicaria]